MQGLLKAVPDHAALLIAPGAAATCVAGTLLAAQWHAVRG